jgi:probable phosphoglycerate mutase
MTGVEVGGNASVTLVRHGQTEDNAAGRWQGTRDSPLTAEGRRQVETLALRLEPDGPCVAIYASPLARAVRTAEILAPLLGAPMVWQEPDLREYDFGAWDGLTPAELRARGFWREVTRDPEFTPPAGEAFGTAARRVERALRTIAGRHRGSRVLVVGHGLTLAAALAQLLDGDPRQAPRYALANGAMAELAMNDRPRLVHLDPPIS